VGLELRYTLGAYPASSLRRARRLARALDRSDAPPEAVGVFLGVLDGLLTQRRERTDAIAWRPGDKAGASGMEKI
jgi:hypothetical protein